MYPAATHEAPRQEVAPARPEPPVWAVCLGIFLVALVLRQFRIVPSYDLFIDEVTYTEIARNIGQGRGVTHYGEPFDLHPPVVMATFGLVIRLFGLDGNLADVAFALRPLAALFGAGTAVLAFLLGRRMGFGLFYALAAAALVALDPFVIRYDSRVMLEAETQFFTALTILLVMSLPHWRSATAYRWALGLAGLSAGLTFCSKETFGLVLGAALVVIGYTNRIAPRRDLAAITGIGLGLYVTNLALTIWLGGLDAWMEARGNGLTRLIGLNKETGFNSEEVKVSLLSRLTANLDRLAVTYLLLVLGGLCCLALLRRIALWRAVPFAFGALPREVSALVAWALAACGYLVYATLFGSIEEQMYYIPLLPCILSVVAVLALRDARPRHARRRRISHLAQGTLIALLLAVDLVVWARVHSTDDSMYRQFFAWARTGFPPDSRVAVTEDSAQFVLSGVEVGSWHTAEQLRENQVDYVLINPSLVEQGYGVGDAAFLAYLRENGRPVFSARSAQDGQLLVFDVRSLDGAG